MGLQIQHWIKQILTLCYVIYGRWLPYLSSYPFTHDYAFMDYIKRQWPSLHTTELKLGLWDVSLSNHTTVYKSPKSPRQGNRLWHATVTRIGNHKSYKRYNAFSLFCIWATKYIAWISLNCPLGAIFHIKKLDLSAQCHGLLLTSKCHHDYVICWHNRESL